MSSLMVRLLLWGTRGELKYSEWYSEIYQFIRLRAPEALFRPAFGGLESPGILETV
jgi:hypothetical protein